MIPASRFLVRSTDRERWLAVREGGVSATTVAEAATPAGFARVVEERRNPVEVVPNEYMLFGTESEADLMDHAHREFGILPNDWIIASADTPRLMATPDGLSVDHKVIAECKTAGTIPKSIPRKHRDQMLWQMFCTGAERGLYVVNSRVPDGRGWFRLGLFEPVTFWLDRDEKRIAELVEVADRLLLVEGEDRGVQGAA